jgi:predicted nucleic acid-binding protein
VKRALLDLNVVLDVLFQRDPFVKEGALVFRRIESGDLKGYLAAHTITTLYYLAAKRLGRAKCRKLVLDVLQLFEVVPVDGQQLRYALGMDWKDFEDAVQAACAEEAEVDFLVTRDKKGFRASTVTVVTPGELLAQVLS